MLRESKNLRGVINLSSNTFVQELGEAVHQACRTSMGIDFCEQLPLLYCQWYERILWDGSNQSKPNRGLKVGTQEFRNHILQTVGDSNADLA